MDTILLDASTMLTHEEAHRALSEALHFPEYYGNNLDALWDLVTTTRACVKMTNVACMLNALGAYGCKLLQTLFEAAQENPDFLFTLV